MIDGLLRNAKMDDSSSLIGQLLIATPAIQESCFARSVIYVCAHNEAGAMGIIINFPIENLNLSEIFQQLQIHGLPSARELPIHFGGPVESNRGFVVHSADYIANDSLVQKDGIAVTASISILHDLAQGKGPSEGILVLGYAGWSPKQLEAEIESGSWITVPATRQLLFHTDNTAKWNLAVGTLGFDMGHFSTVVGHA